MECLQDLTGGGPAFYLASYSLMVDLTNTADRTRRLSVLDSFIPIGFLTGLPLGTLIKSQYGYVAVFCAGCGVILLCLLYVLFLVTEERQEKQETEDLRVELNRGHLMG